MAVEKDDALEADGREGDREIFDERHERGDANVHQPLEAHVRIRKRVVHGRRHDRADRRCDAPRDLLRNQHVGEQREMRPMLFGGAHRDDDGMAGLQEVFDFGVRHLSEKHGRRLHRSLVVSLRVRTSGMPHGAVLAWVAAVRTTLASGGESAGRTRSGRRSSRPQRAADVLTTSRQPCSGICRRNCWRPQHPSLNRCATQKLGARQQRSLKCVRP